MNMKQRNSYLFVILCWLCTYGFPVQAQDTSLQAIEEAINSYNYRQAIDLIGRLDSVTPDLQRKKLAAYKELNQYSDAVRLLNEMIAADSLNTHLYIERANCYLMQNSDNKALEEYGKALELAGLKGQEVVIDAYCGIGTIGIIASRQAGQVIGVELNQDAVKDAVNNAKMNDIDNIRFYCNDAGRFLVNMAERGDKADVVIMDPPRSGSTEEFMDSIAKLGAGKVVYVSCNPETLARDVRYMKKLGYAAEGVWPVDMFPATVHVETVIMMTYCGEKKK